MQPWNLVFLSGFAAYIAIRGVFIERTRTSVKADRRVDLQERALLFASVKGLVGWR